MDTTWNYVDLELGKLVVDCSSPHLALPSSRERSSIDHLHERDREEFFGSELTYRVRDTHITALRPLLSFDRSSIDHLDMSKIVRSS